VKNDVKAVFAFALFVVLVLIGGLNLNLGGLRTGQPVVQPIPAWSGEPTTPENPTSVARFMFGPYALPLEVLSIALFVALVAAILLAKPDPPGA